MNQVRNPKLDGHRVHPTSLAVIVTAFLLACCVSACNRSAPEEGGIARVGSKRLTLAEARRAIDTTQGPFTQQLPKYISTWVTDELLYQEAQREGMENNESFKEQLEQTRRHLAIQNLLQQYVYEDTAGINEAALRAYFAEHAGEFIVRENMMKLNIIGFTSREFASNFAAAVTAESPWSAAVAKAKADPSVSGSIIALPTNQYFSELTLFPPELWKVASSLNVDEVSFPVRTNLGYFVIQLLSFIPEGKPAELDIVRDEVNARLLIERRRQKYAEYLGTLRKRYDVEVLLNSITLEDSTKSQHHE